MQNLMYFIRDTFPALNILVEFVKDLHWATPSRLKKLPIVTIRSDNARAAKTLLKNVFQLHHSVLQLFLPTYFVKYRQTLLELNSVKCKIRYYFALSVMQKCKEFIYKKVWCRRKVVVLPTMLLTYFFSCSCCCHVARSESP